MFRRTVAVVLLVVALVLPAMGVALPTAVAAPADTASTAVDPAPPAQLEPSATSAVASTGDGDIHQRKVLALTPDSAGEIRTTVTYEIPDDARSLNVTVPSAATVRRLEGFDRTDERTYEWDGVTASPSIAFDFRVNRTYGGGRRPELDALTARPAEASAVRSAQTSGYSFVDAGPWAITQIPSLSVVWTYVGTSPVRLDKSLSIDGEGASGSEIAYLGPMSSHTRTANGQRFRLVVPAAATMAESPGDVLQALGRASGMLLVGARDERVFFVAAPTGVDWGPRGLEYGGSDAWVRADASLSSATNVWFHEYVHTRQSFRTTAATTWTTEGMADYYAALLSLRQGEIDFSAFSRHLERGTSEPYADAVLADPSTWSIPANYLKGALVFGTVDRRIRLAGDRSADAVFARMNADSDRVTQAEFLDAVAAAGTDRTRDLARRYTETSDVPEMWSRQEHFRAFPGDQPIAYRFDAATYRVTGPFRNRTITPDRTLVTGETLHVELPIRNDGSERATYEVAIRHNGSTVETRTGTIAAGASATVSLSAPLDAPGTSAVTAGSNVVPFEVASPAPVRVTGLSVSPASPTAGEQVTARATVRNPADRPAAGTVTLTVDGAVREERRVTLAPGATASIPYTLTFASPGAYVVSARNESRTIQVTARPTTSDTSDSGTESTAGTSDRSVTPVTTPLRWSTVLAALALAVVLFGRR